MKRILCILALSVLPLACGAQSAGTDADRESLRAAAKAIRDAFASGDVDRIVALHHPDIVKYFGGTKVVNGRDELRKGLVQMLTTQRMEFVENTVESTVFVGDVAVQTGIFAIRVTPKGGKALPISRGRAMVVYVRSKDSPTGWLSLREMAQAAPQAGE